MFPDMINSNLFGAMCVGLHSDVYDDNNNVISSGRRRGMKRLSGCDRRNSGKIENTSMNVHKQDTLTFLLYAFVCIWTTRRLVHTIATYERLLYLFNNDTHDSSNDCTDSTNPCTFWYQTSEITSGDILVIDKGNFAASISLDIDSNDEWIFENYTIIGSGADKTVIEFSDKYDALLNFDASSAEQMYPILKCIM